jgi:hypothetical protein
MCPQCGCPNPYDLREFAAEIVRMTLAKEIDYKEGLDLYIKKRGGRGSIPLARKNELSREGQYALKEHFPPEMQERMNKVLNARDSFFGAMVFLFIISCIVTFLVL